MPQRVVKLGTSINIHDPETGEVYLYDQGETVPSEHVALVTHDLAWEKEEDVASYQEYLRRVAGANSSDPEGEPPITGGVRDDLDDMNVQALREFADENVIDLGNATRKADILSAIREAQAAEVEEEEEP